jgi:dihydrofolate reductase
MTTQYYTATSIDGFIADADHSLDWLFPVERDTEKPDRFDRFFAGVGAMAMGSTTYEWVLAHEELLDHPERWTAFYGETPTWVFTSRGLPAVPGADLTFVEGDVRPIHTTMTAAAGGRNVWVVGGGDLAGQFADVGLLDEIILGVAPVTLGSGAPLLPRRLLTTDLRLTGVDRDLQLAMLTYSVVHAD